MTIVKIEKEFVTRIPTVVVILELSAEEAIMIRAMCNVIGGNPADTARGLSDSISEKLRKDKLPLPICNIFQGYKLIATENSKNAVAGVAKIFIENAYK